MIEMLRALVMWSAGGDENAILGAVDPNLRVRYI
jgi:hypothetical protein